jgi:hypothetical protein
MINSTCTETRKGIRTVARKNKGTAKSNPIFHRGERALLFYIEKQEFPADPWSKTTALFEKAGTTQAKTHGKRQELDND